MAKEETLNPIVALTTTPRGRRNGKGKNGSGKPRKKKNRHISKDPDLIIRILQSKLWHHGRRTFRSDGEVAKDLSINVQVVTPAMKEAFRRGWFSNVVHHPQELLDVPRLEEAVKRHYNLEKVLLVPGSNDIILEDLDRDRRDEVHTEIMLSMAQRVAPYLDALVAASTEKRGPDATPFVLGVAWGRTILRIADYLRQSPRPVRTSLLKVVPIVGITNGERTEAVEANLIAMEIAKVYGGVSAQLASPAFVHRLEAHGVMQTAQVRDMLKTIRNCNVVLTGMGPIPERLDNALDITLCGDEGMNAKLYASARANGAIGDICYWLYDEDGNEVQTEYAAIGLGYRGLLDIASKPDRRVILVTGADRRRLFPLKVALCRRLASVLVSDTVTARYLMGELEL